MYVHYNHLIQILFNKQQQKKERPCVRYSSYFIVKFFIKSEPPIFLFSIILIFIDAQHLFLFFTSAFFFVIY